MQVWSNHRNRSSWIVALLALAMIIPTWTDTPPAGAQQPSPSGTAPDDAAASCWEIKQNDPSVEDGIYWLQTPELVAPEQFYCDMTTDGGGWVLIGRGRENWRPEYQGQGTPAQVRNVVTGPAAFNTRSLHSKIVDGLLNGGRVDELPDGVRVRRATNASGTSWQDARFQFANRDRWVWSFSSEHPVASYDFGGILGSGSGGTTSSFGKNDIYKRIDTRDDHSGQGWTRGWAFGSLVRGTNSPDSYLWSHSSGVGHARPFTQIYLRPQLSSADLDYSTIADTGTPEQELQPLLQSGAEDQQWGVTGRTTDKTNEHYTETQDATQVGDTVFVGGNFQYVQKGGSPAPAEKVEQSYLAGFDVHTGEWVSSFRPTFDGQVKTLATLPGGTLVAGGEFTEVNGTSVVGLVALDPVTGEINPDWTVTLENRLACCPVRVWDLEVDGDQLYIGGSFTHVQGGDQSREVFARNAARVSVADGSADPGWNPNFNGTVYDMDIGSDGERFYAAGHMTWSNQEPTENVAILSTGEGAPLVPGMKQPEFSNEQHYQQAIVEAGDRVWVGGSEHSLFSYSTSDFSLLSGNITKEGGDFQSAEVYDGVVYATCHCGHWNYSEAYTWRDIGTDWTQADTINFVGAWDTTSGEFLPEFNIWTNTTYAQGPWGSFQDSTGTVWFLGDFREARRPNGTFQWVGGFVRFAPRDTTAPSVPADLTSTDLGEGTFRLSWHGSSDDQGAVRYEVLRDDRVITTTTDTALVVDEPVEAQRYFVRAIDATGNRSASTPVHVLGPTAPAGSGDAEKANVDTMQTDDAATERRENE